MRETKEYFDSAEFERRFHCSLPPGGVPHRKRHPVPPVDPHCGVSPEFLGKYLALCQEGTTLDRDGRHPTCLDYLKRLGVTDGFRFDLMGLLDVQLMERIRAALDRRFGEGEKLLFGEPWSAGTTAAMPSTVLADKNGLRQLSLGVGGFCDATRDAVKGPIAAGKGGVPGFVNGGGLDGETLLSCIRGWTEPGEPFAVPAQTINYLSCHDNWTLWDKLALTMDPEKRFKTSAPALLRANRLAAAICFTCQGHLFLLSGEEFARTKSPCASGCRGCAISQSLPRTGWAGSESPPRTA